MKIIKGHNSHEIAYYFFSQWPMKLTLEDNSVIEVTIKYMVYDQKDTIIIKGYVEGGYCIAKINVNSYDLQVGNGDICIKRDDQGGNIDKSKDFCI